MFGAWSSGLSAAGGSTDSTSAAKALSQPEWSASATACSSMSGPRPVLMRIAPCFIFFIESAFITCSVAGVNGQ